MDFSERETKLLTYLEAVAFDETRRLLKLTACEGSANLAEILALLVVQTSCCQRRNCECCFMDGMFFTYHEDIFKMFVKHTCKKQTIASKSNFGRPLLRLLSHTDQQPEVSGGEGTLPSEFLWKLKETVASEVPAKYSKFWGSALLYLSITDASSSFIKPRERPGEAPVAMELPCLIEMFGCSSCNNQHNFSAFMSEYIALLHVGLHDEFVGDQFVCKAETETFDFRIEKTEQNQTTAWKFSVKTINESTKYFGDLFQSDELTCIDKFEYESEADSSRQVSQANIFLYRCENCRADPVRKLEFAADDDLSPSVESGCSCDESLKDILQSIQGEMYRRIMSEGKPCPKVMIYLVSTRLSNDIRFAVGCKNQFRDRQFPLNDFLVNCLQDHFRDKCGRIPPGVGQENSQPFALLKDRSRCRAC